MNKCEFCLEYFEEAPFVIITHDAKFEPICGICMNLWANDDFEELSERMLNARGIKASRSIPRTETR